MDKETHNAVVTIAKLDPAVEKKTRRKEFTAPFEGMTVLQVLDHIYEHLDPGLAYRFGCCGSGPTRCGACAMEVNGKPVLACKKEAEKEMTITPHRKYQVIKDLVIDFEKPKD